MVFVSFLRKKVTKMWVSLHDLIIALGFNRVECVYEVALCKVSSRPWCSEVVYEVDTVFHSLSNFDIYGLVEAMNERNLVLRVSSPALVLSPISTIVVDHKELRIVADLHFGDVLSLED